MQARPYSLSAGVFLATLTLCLQPLAAQTDRLWNGPDGDFNLDPNWTPEGIPAPVDNITLSSGNAVHAGNLNRAALTTINGSGILTVDGGRFLNASGAAGSVEISGGALAHTGQFFIAALNNAGTITQTGGTVTTAVTEAFFLSDGGGSVGNYTLTGGSLEVLLSGTSGLDRQVHLGKQNNGDLMVIDGGAATFRADSANRRFYVSRNSTLRVDSGSLDADGFFYFIVGRELVENTNSTMEMNGGRLDILNTPGGGAFIVGAGNDGLLRLRGGALSAVTAPMWLGDGRTGTVVHTGGTLDLGAQPMILARANGGHGQYQLDGGTLTADAITAGPGTNPAFIFRSGTLTLNGDQRALVDEPWFTAAGQVSSVFDETAGTTTLTAVPVAGKESAYRYFRFTATRLRDPFNTAVQLSEVEFLNNGEVIDRSMVTVENPGGTNPGVEAAFNVVDGDVNTKWLDTANQPLVFDFGTAVAIDGYRLVTANDAIGRDPLRWTLEGSADGEIWTALDRMNSNFPMPTGRFISTLEIPLPQDVPEAPPAPVSLTWTGAVNAEWNTTALNWTADGPAAWSDAAALEAVFAAAGPKAVSLPAPITASALNFSAAGYTVSGTGPLTLTEPAAIAVTGAASLDVPLEGTAGWKKTGEETLTVSGNQNISGPALLDAGQVVYTGSASASGNGNLVLANGEDFRASLRMDSAGTLDFSGSVRLGPGDRSAGVIHQSEGTVNAGGPNTVEYLELGGGIATATGSYGAYHLTGGTLNTVAGAAPSGIRVGNEGLGVLLQTGGVLNSARWVAIGGTDGANGEGVASFLGGEATVAPGYRFLIGDRPGAVGTLNVGSLAGGTAVVTTLNAAGLTVAANGGATLAVLNLNPGTLVLGGPITRASGGADARANFNGGTLRAGAPDISLLSAGMGQAFLYNGGLTVDTAGFNAGMEASLFAATGPGLYPAGGGVTPPAGGAGYLGAPLVTVFSNGAGGGATAIAEIADGSISRVLITCPGQNYAAGETLTFSFAGGGAADPLLAFDHVLTDADLRPNDTGGLVKTGEGKLTVSGSLFYTGGTAVSEGTLEATGTIDGTPVSVAPPATLAGTLNTSSPVMVAGTLAPGSGVGTAVGTSSLTLAAGSVLAVELADWTGEPGVGYDSASFASLIISATATEKLTVALDSTLLANFGEGSRSFTLVGTSGPVTGLQAGNWQVEAPGFPGAGTWQLASSGNALVLNYTATGTAYDTWLGGFANVPDPAPGADPDKDGIANVMEYVLDGNPAQSSTGILPVAETTPAGLVFSFVRRSGSTADTMQVFQYGSGLGGWTDLMLPQASSGDVVITPETPSSGRETVRITLPASAAVEGRLFGRLSVVRN